MKKTIPILLVLIIFLVYSIGNAVAEDYSIHSGVTFGMSIDEVKDHYLDYRVIADEEINTHKTIVEEKEEQEREEQEKLEKEKQQQLDNDI